MEIIKDNIGEAHTEVVRAIIEEGSEQTIEVEPGKFMKTWEYPDPITIIVRHPEKPPFISPASPYGEKFIEEYSKSLLTITCKDPVENEKRNNGRGFVYRYPDRLFDYPVVESTVDYDQMENPYTKVEHCGNGDGFGINQIDYVIRELAETPMSRRAEAITWVPKMDIGSKDPPCLQFTHFLMRKGIQEFDQEPDVWYLSLRAPFRSHDMMSGYGSNANGLRGLTQYVIDGIKSTRKSTPSDGKLLLEEDPDIRMGSLVTFSSSAHIYCETQSDDLRSFKRYLRIS